jgi:putative ABC transport system permease protein
VRAGDRIKLALGTRQAEFRVLDVYYDYASERGYVLTDRKTMLGYLPDPAPSNAAVYLREGVTLQEGRHAVEKAVGDRRIVVLSNRTLREQAIRIFDRTFAITYALEAVAVFVAVMGVAGALAALVIDRRREFGLLRFLGGSTDQVRRLIFFEAGLLGLLANVAGLALGYFLSLLLIYVINKQSFGWTIQFHWPAAVLPVALILVYVATLVSAVYPARVAARLNPIEVIHEE